MPRIIHKDDKHIIHTILLKFGQWDIREQDGHREIIDWICPVCNQSELPNSIDYFSSHIANHILHHTSRGSVHFCSSTDNHDSIYVILLCYLQRCRINYTLKACIDESRIISGIIEKNQIYDDHIYDPHTRTQLYEMHSITNSCAFCEHYYVHKPTDDMVIDHAATCFSTTCVKNHK